MRQEDKHWLPKDFKRVSSYFLKLSSNFKERIILAKLYSLETIVCHMFDSFKQSEYFIDLKTDAALGKSHLICLPAMFLISNKGSLQAANDSLRIFVKQLQEISIFPSNENRLFVVLMSYCTIFDKGKLKEITCY